MKKILSFANKILVYAIISVLFLSPITFAYCHELSSLRPQLLVTCDEEPRSGAIAKLESIRIVEIKDIGNDRVELHTIIQWLNKTTEFPIILHAKRAPNLITADDIEKMKTGDKQLDDALIKTYGEIPRDNYFILEENFYRIRGFGQFAKDGICACGLVESLSDKRIAKWHELMHIAHQKGMVSSYDVAKAAMQYSKYSDLIKGFEKRTKNMEPSSPAQFHYALILFQECRWRYDNIALERKIQEPIVIPGDKEELEERIQNRLLSNGSACRMWEDFLGDAFGHGRMDIQLELINKCPLNCDHCLAWPKMKSFPRKDMPIDEAKTLITNLAGANKICFTGGEPFLYYNAVNKMLDGKVSDKFLELIRFASRYVEEVIIDTCGIGIPAKTAHALYEAEAKGEEANNETNELRKKLKAEVLEFFRLFPDNVVIEVSLDPEHEDKLKKFKKELRDIVRFCEVARENGRKIRYNFRYKLGEHTKTLARLDYNGALSRMLDIDRRHRDDKNWTPNIRESKTKLQGNAADCFNPSTYSEEGGYALMRIDKIVENIFPDKTFLYVSSAGEVYFDFHTGSMLNAPAISRLGDLKDKTLAEVMLDGILGRLVGFDRHPCLKYLYLARFFHMMNDYAISEACLNKAIEDGADYVKRYRDVVDKALPRELALFERIVSSYGDEDASRMHFLRHVFVASIDTLLRPDAVSWLTGIIPNNTDCVWDCYSRGEGIVAASVRDFVMNSDTIEESIKLSCNAVTAAVRADSVVTAHIALKTSKDGKFSFIPIHRKISDISGYEKNPVNIFNGYLSLMLLYWGEHYSRFISQLRQDLTDYAQSEHDETRKQLAEEYISQITEVMKKDITIPPVDITAWFIHDFAERLEPVLQYFVERDRYNTIKSEVVSIAEIEKRLRNGVLSPFVTAVKADRLRKISEGARFL